MAEQIVNDDKALVSVSGTCGAFPVDNAGGQGYTIKEILLNESILNPGLQTIVTLQSDIYMPGKNLDSFKNSIMGLSLSSRNGSMTIDQKIYRLDRKSTRLNSSHTDISRMPSSA